MNNTHEFEHTECPNCGAASTGNFAPCAKAIAEAKAAKTAAVQYANESTNKPNLGKPRADIEHRTLCAISWTTENWPRRMEIIQPVVDRIMATGECIWHAHSMVLGVPCHCADCARRPRNSMLK